MFCQGIDAHKMTKDRDKELKELNFTYPVGKRKVNKDTIATVYNTWKERYQDLVVEFNMKHGHTDVPQG